jgi:WD40 repeat protein
VQRLAREAVRRAVVSLRDDLGRADRSRLDAIVALIEEDGRIRLDEALRMLYPGQQREAALTAFRQFRGRLSAAAAEARLAFALETDRQTRASPEERSCWFSGQDDAAAAAVRLTEAETADVERSAQNAVEIGAKRAVRYFVCYAHGDRTLKEDLLTRLGHCFGAAKDYRFEGWHDGDIELGSNWHERIQAAIRECDFGLLLVSPAFLASAYIEEHELPHFVGRDPFRPSSGKRAAPIALKAIRFDGKMDLKGLEKQQFFIGKDGKAYEQLSGNAPKNGFAGDLFVKIVEIVATAPSQPPVLPQIRKIGGRLVDRYLKESIDLDLAEIHFVPTEGHTATQNKLEETGPPGERRDALAFLNEWVREPAGAPYCALLGEYGIGKTTTSMAFARGLLEDRATSPGLPLPIYLDLRNLGEAGKAEPNLLQIIDTVLRRSWRGGFTDMPLSAEEVVRLVQQEGALAIFDGLDEVLVHLSPGAGQRFTREILRMLPPALTPRRRKPELPGRPGHVLVTCRTHYFRTLRDQTTHLTVEDRGDVRGEDYRVFVLLPFTEEQVRTYLRHTLPSEDTDRVLETIRAVHNLTELAERPYTLSLIARHFPRIEQWKLEGRRVTGVLLYRHMVLSWLERDTGKHQISPDHKQQLMEYLAAELWRSGKRTWSVGDVEQWLIDFLRARPALAAHYDGKDRELLKEDLRTATFLVRDGEADFRFAHSSLLEFFLAGHLYSALGDGRIADLDLPLPNHETLDFLGQMLDSGGSEPALQSLRAIRDGYRPRISEMAFAYILLAQKKGYPATSPAGFRLDGADLQLWDITRRSGELLLSLRAASFRGARLSGVSFGDVDLEGADFSGADLARAELIGGRARDARFTEADLGGAVLRDINVERSDFAGAILHRTKFLRCGLTGARGLDFATPRAFFALCEPAERCTPVMKPSPRLAAFVGHSGAIWGCTFAPDGRRLASASDDNTVRLWDPVSAECLAVLRGHESGVFGCAFTPDGRSLASASSDNTLRLWDPVSAECLAVLRGHESGVFGCAFGPNGRRLASASDDNTVRLWDPVSAECLAVLRGHESGVLGCAFTPDGRLLASASDDNTVRLWDPVSGECLRVLGGHGDGVLGCAFAPDGRRLAVACSGGRLRLWDVPSGECRAVLHGHDRWVRACAFAPDGHRLASASDDNTVRLWDPVSGECLAVLRGHQDAVWGCAFAPDGRRLASASRDGTLRLWNPVSGECLAVLRRHYGWVWGCAFGLDGTHLSSTSPDNTLRLWDPASGKGVAVLRGHEGPVSGCAFAPSGRHLASASFDGTLRLWDLISCGCLAVLRGHDAEVSGCAFAPDGSRLASTSYDNTLRLWDPVSGECLAVLRGHQEAVSACAFASGGRLLASASDDATLRLWEPGSGECLTILRGHSGGVWDCGFTPDGRRLVSASVDSTLRLWDVISRKCLAVLRGHSDRVRGCSLAPDGRHLASASDDKTLRLWDLGSGECMGVLRGHESAVLGCAFAPDSRRLASASFDGTLRLWDLASRQETGSRWHLFNDGSWAALDLRANKIIQVSGDAWRWLGWFAADGVTRYPAEILGSLPESKL